MPEHAPQTHSPATLPARTARRLSPLLGWLLLAVLALGTMGTVTFRVAVNHLHAEAEAEAAATDWARTLVRLVPSVAERLRGAPLPADDLRELSLMTGGGTVLRFELRSPQGRTVHDSAVPAAAADAGPSAPRQGGGALAVGPSATDIELVRQQRDDGPVLHGRVDLPLLQAGQGVGQLRVWVDLTGAVARVQRSALIVMAAGAATLLLLAGVGGWRLWLQRRADARVRYLARHDLLTGVLNRTSFRDAMQHAVWSAEQGHGGFAVLCVDLDRFKAVNDSLGHQAGDELLRQVARRLQAAARSGDVVSRLGGDEFALLQSGIRGGDDVSALARRVVGALGEPFDLMGQRVQVAASVGAAIHGIDGADVDALLHHADLALYRAKTGGGGGFSFYDAGLDERLQRRRALTQDLREAIANESLQLHFQPLFDAGGRDCVGYEALLRWNHATRGAVSPVEFIPLAEETGLIDSLGRWALRAACREAARWQQPRQVAVNLSVAQFRQGDALVAEVRQALADSGLPASRLELEITESLLISNPEQALKVLGELHDLGVRIAMDDFGTGYSSLAYLWRFPFDKVKIDRSFTRHLGEDARVDLIVSSIVSLAHSLRIRVNAEGVETEAQLAVLSRQGCDEVQGFLLGRPGPATPDMREAADLATA